MAASSLPTSWRREQTEFGLQIHVAIYCINLPQKGNYRLMNRQGRPPATRWIMAEPPDQQLVDQLVDELRIPPPIAGILLQRNIGDFQTAKNFFRPSLTTMHDPFLMDGMEPATERILRALKSGEQICVYGDYDVDGTNATAMLYLFLRELGGNLRYHIPDRITEGYGLSRPGIDKAAEAGVTLLITVDCGITAAEQVRGAASLGIETIICDHHEAGAEIPPAVAVLDPMKPGDSYPFKGLCGCGVALKLIQAIAGRVGRTDLIGNYLEFAALGTIADIVPLVDENRVLVKAGLESINASAGTGIRALIREAGLGSRQISTGQVVFALAPRINAAGRLGDAGRAVRLLISDNDQESAELARILEKENLKRRQIDETTFEQAVAMAEESPTAGDDAAIVLHADDWHPGVIGIVASRMVERYYRPSIMLTTVDGVAKGSARSVPGFDLYHALTQCSDMIVQFGGHKYAAGLTLEIPRIPEFAARFREVVDAAMTDELRTPGVRIDAELSLSDLTPRFVRIMKEFAPFGPGNSKPQFLVRNVEVAGTPRIVGKNHLKFRVRDGNQTLDAIGFGLGDLLPEIHRSTGLDIVFSVEENEYVMAQDVGNGETIPQLKIRDLRSSDVWMNKSANAIVHDQER